jgi:hypothetical protein
MLIPVLALTLQLGASAAPRPETTGPHLVPGTTYDARIPTLEEVVGHQVGEDVTSPEEIVAYFRALHAAAPERTRFVEYGRTWEGRPLVALIVASPERITNLDRIKGDIRKLADPRGVSAAEGERLVRELPVVVALLHGVHGNEISSGGAAMSEAYHLLAAQNDPAVDQIRRDAIVIIDPAQNPDGRGRFVYQYRVGRGPAPDADPLGAEHDEPWPGGRANHYLFDLNRDWFAQTQRESQGRVAFLLEWMPQVVADLHEMGGDSTYYFPPSAPPGNPHTTESQTRMLEDIGKGIASKFDARGFAYFNREVFDAFYPGYGVSWPIAQGFIGMTFEQASARGLQYRRRDGTILSYWDGILHHFTAAMSTAETAARNRERMVREFLEFRRSAVRDGETAATREYILTSTRDAGQVERLARLLVKNGIEVRQTVEPTKVGTRSIPAGAFTVSLAQPAGRLARNLLDAHTPMDAAFLAVQEERRKRRQPDQIYDVTAWSLPLLWDVDALPSATPLTVRTTPFAPAPVAATALPAAKLGYLIPWNASAATAVTRALADGVKVSFSPAAFTLGGRSYTKGTAIVRVHENSAEALRTLATHTRAAGAEVVGIDSAFTEAGISLGSNQVFALVSPRVLLAWDVPTQSLSAGWARYVLEQRYGQRVSAIRTGTIGRADLAQYDVIVLPSGSYSAALSADQVRRLKDWVSAGGTLITIAEASRWAGRESIGLLESRTELSDGAPETDGPARPRTDASRQPFDFDRAITPAQERPDLVPGAILRVRLDGEHWLASGHDDEIGVMVESQRVFTPITLDKGVNVGVYQKSEQLLASGIIWDESRKQVAQKSYLVEQPLGRGRVIAFAEDPNGRAFAEGSQLLFLNAVLLGGSR